MIIIIITPGIYTTWGIKITIIITTATTQPRRQRGEAEGACPP